MKKATELRRLRYVTGDYLKANGRDLCSVPLTVEGDSEPIGELEGAVIDLQRRRVCYLVVDVPDGGKQMVPLDMTRFSASEGKLLLSRSPDTWVPFEASAYRAYDDDAMVSLMFGSNAA